MTDSIQDDELEDERPRKPLPPPDWRVALVVALLVVAGLGTLAYKYLDLRRPATITNEPIAEATRTIAIVPFTPDVAVKPDPVYAIGTTATLIGRLSQLRSVVVRPVESVRPFVDAPTEGVAAGKKLHVDAVVWGTYEATAYRLRFSVTVSRVKDGETIWSNDFTGAPNELFSLHDEMTRQIAEALSLHVVGNDPRLLTQHATESIAAYRLWSEALNRITLRTSEDVSASIPLFDKASDADTGFAPAFGDLARAYAALGMRGAKPPDDAFKEARKNAENALKLDDSLAEAHVALGVVHMLYDHDWPGAERELRLALDIVPNHPEAHQALGWYLQAMGRLEEALYEMQAARDLDPGWPDGQASLVEAMIFAGRTEQADRTLNPLLKAEPKRADLLRLSQLLKPVPPPAAAKPVVPASAIDRAAELALAERADEAFAALDTARGAKEPWLWRIKVDPRFDAIRDDPRYESILADLGLKP